MSLLANVSDLGPGDHACLVYDSFEDRDERLLAFLLAGLAEDERLIYVDDGTNPGVIVALSQQAKPGQLIVLGDEEAYLLGGEFDPGHVLETFRVAVDSSVAMGFSAVRAAGGPPVALTSNGYSHGLPAYERDASTLFGGGRLSAICAYDVRRTSPASLVGIVDAHPIVIYAVGPDERLRVDQPSVSELVLHGWVDVTTVGGLVAPLADAIATGDDVELDLGGVDFIDVGGWRLFGEAAAALEECGRALRVRHAPSWAPPVLRILGYDGRQGLVLQ
jgi:hypothetical protein